MTDISDREVIIQLQSTVLSLQNRINEIATVLNNVSKYADQIDKAAGTRITRLEKHVGLELVQSGAVAPTDTPTSEDKPTN